MILGAEGGAGGRGCTLTFAVVVVDVCAPGRFGEGQRRLLRGQVQEGVLHKQAGHAAVPSHPGLRQEAQGQDLHPHALRGLGTEAEPLAVVAALLHVNRDIQETLVCG